ncbi:unnamed protein product [Brugia timori]|uniref:Uncharacterized protein n=1 Tax=Brugia timori TaxID=42155 RepID=A0A0R3QVI3_9BILA|nr:unnamed protein product [Brugia timori]
MCIAYERNTAKKSHQLLPRWIPQKRSEKKGTMKSVNHYF